MAYQEEVYKLKRKKKIAFHYNFICKRTMLKYKQVYKQEY